MEKEFTCGQCYKDLKFVGKFFTVKDNAGILCGRSVEEIEGWIADFPEDFSFYDLGNLKIDGFPEHRIWQCPTCGELFDEDAGHLDEYPEEGRELVHIINSPSTQLSNVGCA